MAGEATPGQIGGFLMALRTKGETADEVEGLARTMLEFAQPVATPRAGDRHLSAPAATAAARSTSRPSRAIVVAGAGVPVAKHGNRAASSHCGSADVLEALGVKIDLDAGGVERCLAEAGIAFLFAPMFHPVHGPRRARCGASCGCPPCSTSSGPLTNPARPYAQVVGVSDARMLPLMAEVLARRGTRAMLFRGDDGLDELTTTGISTVFDVQGRAGQRDPSRPRRRSGSRARRRPTCREATPPSLGRDRCERIARRRARARAATSCC